MLQKKAGMSFGKVKSGKILEKILKKSENLYSKLHRNTISIKK